MSSSPFGMRVLVRLMSRQHKISHTSQRSKVGMSRLPLAIVFSMFLVSAYASLGHSQNISGLSTEDQTSIKIACVNAEVQGPAPYHACLRSQVARLGTSTAPDISGLSTEDQTSIKIACVNAEVQGPAPYHTCLNAQLAQLGESSHPPSSRSALPSTAATTPPAQSSPACSESGSCYGDISERTGLPKTTYVPGYFRKNGTYVRSYYRSK
jgi:hypothetical protein